MRRKKEFKGPRCQGSEEKKILISAIIFVFLVLLSCSNNPLEEIRSSIVSVHAYDKEGELLDEGSGFIVRSDGAVATNFHIISEAQEIRVKRGGKVLNVEGIIHKDFSNDIVILKTKGSRLPAVRLGDINEVRFGDTLFFVKSPDNTVSEGKVRWIKEASPGKKVILIEASLITENSGSPVFNKDGEVIGIATLLFGEEEEEPFFAISTAHLKEKIENRNFPALKGTEIESYEETPEYWMNIGFFSTESSFHRESISAFQKALTLRPDDPELYNQLGIVYGRIAQYDKEIESYEKAISIKPDYAEPYNNLGFVHNLYNRKEEAINSYKKAIQLKPDYASAYSNLGVIYGEAGKHKLALETFKKAVELEPDNAMAHFNLGIAYGSLGMNKEVVRAYENAVKINPDFIRARYNLGVAYLNISKPESAYDEYKKIKHANPELAGRLFNLIDQEWKRLKKARKPA